MRGIGRNVLGVLAGVAAMGASSALAAPISPTQGDLLAFTNISGSFGGSGVINSAVAAGDGVTFDLTLGTDEFGKTPIGALNAAVPPLDIGSNLTGFSEIRYYVTIVSADGPIEFNPFFQDTGFNFDQGFSGVLNVGDATWVSVPLSGNLNDIKGIGFQIFTAGGVENPAANNVMIHVSPVPEPASLGLLGLAGLALLRRRR